MSGGGVGRESASPEAVSGPAAVFETPEIVTAARRLDRALLEQFWRFSVVGISCTTLFAFLYWLIQPALGPQTANFLATLTAAVLNTAANRAFTFRLHGARGLAVHHVHGVALFVFGWLLTAGALYLLHHFASGTSREIELVVLLSANGVGTALRFLVFRHIFRPVEVSTA